MKKINPKEELPQKPQKPKTKHLITEKVDKFCREYVLCMNASEAYRRAFDCLPDTKPKNIWSKACEMKSRSEVKARIESLKNDIEEMMKINKTIIIQNLMDIRDRSMQKVPVMKFNPKIKDFEQVVDDSGEGVWQYDSTGANSALDKIIKVMGYYAPTKNENLDTVLQLPTTISFKKT